MEIKNIPFNQYEVILETKLTQNWISFMGSAIMLEVSEHQKLAERPVGKCHSGKNLLSKILVD